MSVTSKDIEEWVKVRTVLDLVNVELAEYKDSPIPKPLGDVLNIIHNAVAELYNTDVADKVVKLIEDNIEKDTGELVMLIQKYLINTVFGGRK